MTDLQLRPRPGHNIKRIDMTYLRTGVVLTVVFVVSCILFFVGMVAIALTPVEISGSHNAFVLEWLYVAAVWNAHPLWVVTLGLLCAVMLASGFGAANCE